ncbi:FAD binding domain-containing protein [Kibdelosporangium aridum]|uniref:Xanthine dehydrogenase YagS FAD-binding subunit n=1 Tax=Kibdelosporangium aridum TaxID=2030 RepID=A0A1W1ZGC0_KIBAR|nr:xanthine dehydrogenase family protein subunit M [Kibdelosporangium aridum]SMC47396.1 xanthine dehydrogenase YagS FAD-binding subunit [Kibdelosporangium aridum]
MYPFRFSKAASEREALLAGGRGARYIAGGTTLIDLMRETVERPQAVVDINALPYGRIESGRSGLRIGSLVTMAELARHPRVRPEYPVIAQALELSASAQLRNMATIGGNLMQRTRCVYFRDVTAPCNKRAPGAGCSALEGDNRMHAILGGSAACVATHPSDLAVALVALDARLELRGQGTRVVPLAEFVRRPGQTPQIEHDIRPGELIVAVHVPAGPYTARSGYLKVRDRQSYEFALASAAVALHIENRRIVAARIAVGGVATVPWRLTAVENALLGRTPGNDTWQAAAMLAADGAEPLRHNEYKVELLRRTVARQLETVGGA